MPRIEPNIKGEAAEALDALQKITKKEQPSDVIVSALRIFEWILGAQTNGATIVAEMPDSIRKQLNADGLQLDDYVKDRASAMAYFRDKKIASIPKSTIQERC